MSDLRAWVFRGEVLKVYRALLKTVREAPRQAQGAKLKHQINKTILYLRPHHVLRKWKAVLQPMHVTAAVPLHWLHGVIWIEHMAAVQQCTALNMQGNCASTSGRGSRPKGARQTRTSRNFCCLTHGRS